MALDVSMVLRLVDRLSGPAKRAQASVKGLTRDTGAMGRISAVASRQIDNVQRSAGRLAPVLQRAGAAARRFGQSSLRAIGTGARSAAAGLLALTARAAAGFAALGAGAAAYGAGRFTGSIIGIASQFEQFQVILENTEGSAEKARRSMAWVKEFSKTTPYEVGEVMDAFVKLKAYGLDPTDGTLKALGNSASGMGKDLMSAIEMLADAQTGEFERLKEFGIRAKVQGDKVSLSYRKAGKEIVKTAKNSSAEIQKALIGIMDDRFAGMMDRQSKTLSGMWSNLKDQVANFQLDIANSGFFDFVKGRVQGLLDKVNEMARNGQLEAWARKISDRLTEITTKASDFIENTDWEAAAAGMSKCVTALVGILGWINKVAGAWNAFSNAVNRFEINQERAELQRENARSGWVPEFMGGGRSTRAKNFRRSLELDSYEQSRTGSRPQVNVRPGAKPLPRPAIGPKISAIPIKNELAIKVSAAPGTSAAVAPVRTAANTRLTLNRGRAMANAA